jgi:uncharacterized protein YceK
MRRLVVAATIAAITLSGCGTVSNFAHNKKHPSPQPFGGVASDLQDCRESWHDSTPRVHGWFPGIVIAFATYHGALCCGYLIDATLSTVGDTITLPWTSQAEPEGHHAEPNANSAQGRFDLSANPVISIEGTAQNAKAGAVVVREHGVVYVDGLVNWPQEIVGKHVSVRGVLAVVKQRSHPDSDSPSQEAQGDQQLMLNAKWEEVK